MTTVKVFAPAKVNLTLHVTGQRKDGYHLLDSLVMFADVGDRITLSVADETSLEVIGPMAEGVPDDASNLALRAAGLFEVPVRVILSKHLPMAAGIGGGSADAAAVAMGMCDLIGDRNLPAGLMELGADIRVCLMRQAARMQGIGDMVTPVPGLPPLFAVLANPGVGVATPDVFDGLTDKQGKASPNRLPRFANTGALIKWIAAQRNDLEAPAVKICPEINDVLAALKALEGTRLARMSGSGATCFALFNTLEEAENAGQILAHRQPEWWVKSVRLS